MFSLIDPDNDYWMSVPDVATDSIITGLPHRVFFYSAGNDHYATVRIELWAQQPVQGPDMGEAEGWAIIDVSGHRLCLATTVNGPVAHFTDTDGPNATARIKCLDLPAGRYQLHAVVTGRADASRLPEANWPHGIESWRVRIWPAQSSNVLAQC